MNAEEYKVICTEISENLVQLIVAYRQYSQQNLSKLTSNIVSVDHIVK